MAASTLPVRALIETIWRDFDVPHGIHEEVRLCEPHVSMCADAYELQAFRRNGKHWTWHAVVEWNIRPALAASKGAVIASLTHALEILAERLRFVIPPGWRLFGRHRRRSTWSRLRTKPEARHT